MSTYVHPRWILQKNIVNIRKHGFEQKKGSMDQPGNGPCKRANLRCHCPDRWSRKVLQRSNLQRNGTKWSQGENIKLLKIPKLLGETVGASLLTLGCCKSQWQKGHATSATHPDRQGWTLHKGPRNNQSRNSRKSRSIFGTYGSLIQKCAK